MELDWLMIDNYCIFTDKRFQNLRKNTLRELEAKASSISLSDLKHELASLPLLIRNEHHRLLTVESRLFEEKTFAGVFAHMNLHLSFLDFSLLEHIIGHFGSKSLKKEMEDYKHDVRQFLEVTTISAIVSFLPQRREHQLEPPLKCNFNTTTTTLAMLEEYRKRCASDLLLSDLAILVTKSESSHLNQPLPPLENPRLEEYITATPEIVITNDDNNNVLGRGPWWYIDKGVSQGKSVTVKIFHPESLSHETMKEFTRANEIMKPLENPNLVQVIVATLDKKRRFMIVTEPY